MNAQLDAATLDKIAVATAQIVAMITTRNTAQLVEMFDTLGDRMKGNDFEACADIRGFIMDELERRNPAAFDRWMDQSVTNSPAGFF